MLSEKEIRVKVKQLEQYVSKGKPTIKEYTLEHTKAFLDGLKFALDEKEE